MTDRVDAVVVGAGVIGLSVARALARGGRETVVLEAADGIGTGTSSRNSEVVHAGIYYPAGSLKARHCVAGRRRLYGFCDEFGVGYRRCGKLIVATSESEAAVLRKLEASALANGLAGDDGLVPLSPAEVRRLEPDIACTAALLSPATGIVDSHALMLALLGDAEAHGAMVAFRSPLLSAEAVRGGFHLVVGGPHGETDLATGTLVNAAGLDAPAVAGRIAGLAPIRVPQQHLAKGSYFGLAGRPPFDRLVYPVPVAGGLGVHATLDLAGRVRFGPDVEWVDRIDYAVDPRRADGFYAAIRRYWPGLPDGALSPDYAGIRPKLAGPGAPASDFRLDGPATHSVPGLVNLFGIESPGLTASLSLADAVAAALEQGDA